MLKMKMASKRVKGDQIDKFKSIKSKSTGLYTVKIVYQDESGDNLLFCSAPDTSSPYPYIPKCCGGRTLFMNYWTTLDMSMLRMMAYMHIETLISSESLC